MVRPSNPESAAALGTRLAELNQIGVALSQEKNLDRLLETILLAAKKITNADGGTLYRHPPGQDTLTFEIIRTDSLGIAMGGTTGVKIPYPPIRLRDPQGRENTSMVVANTVLKGRTVAIADAYDAMTSDRAYRRALPHEVAVGEIERCAGSQFDPELAQLFVRRLEEEREAAAGRGDLGIWPR